MKEIEVFPEGSACFRVEGRTIVGSGRRKLITSLTNQKNVPDYRYFVIIKGATEKIIGKSGTQYDFTWKMPIEELYENMGEAATRAYELHGEIGCSSPKCAWIVYDRRAKSQGQKMLLL